MSTSSVTTQVFNQGLLDKGDPVQGVGTLMLPFSFSQIYDGIAPEVLDKICEQLYTRVMQRLQSGDLGNDISFKIVDYRDAQQRSREPSRRYIVITRETNRNTRISVFARFLSYGNKLYVSIDSYVLGALDWWQLGWRLGVTLLPLSCIGISVVLKVMAIPMALVGSSYSESITGSDVGELFAGLIGNIFCCLLPWIVITIPILWLGVIRNYRHEKDAFLSLRQSFNRVIRGQSFNIDDVLMTLKSVLPLVLDSARDVLEENGIPVKTLDAFAENIQTINNVQNIYGNYNAVIGAGGTATTNTTFGTSSETTGE